MGATVIGPFEVASATVVYGPDRAGVASAAAGGAVAGMTAEGRDADRS